MSSSIFCAAFGLLVPAIGLLSHANDAWAADFTLHSDGITTSDATANYVLSGRPHYEDGNPEMTSTKGDIDAINKKLDEIVIKVRCVGLYPGSAVEYAKCVQRGG